MISDDEIASFPSSSPAAFVQLIDILNARLDNSDDNWLVRAHQYVQIVLAFIDEHETELEIADFDRSMPGGHGEYFDAWFRGFRNTINYYQARYRFRREAPVGPALTVVLDNDSRAEVHRLLGKIKKIVAQMEVGDAKRDAIYNKIAALAAEVDKSRTRIDALFSFILESSKTMGEAAENAEPMMKLLERLKDLFANAKSDSTSLPPPARQLPPPKEGSNSEKLTGPAVPKRESSPPKLDDDIPF